MVNFLGGLGGLVGGFYQNKANKAAFGFEKKKAHFGLSQAIRARKMAEFNSRIGRRQAEEAAASSGTYDPSEPMNVGVQSINRAMFPHQMALESAREGEAMAGSALSNLRKQIKNNRKNYYAQQAMNLLGTGIGAYSMMPSAKSFDVFGAANPAMSQGLNQVGGLF